MPSRSDNALQNRIDSIHEMLSAGKRSPRVSLSQSPVTCAYWNCVTGTAANRYDPSSTDHLRHVRRSDNVSLRSTGFDVTGWTSGDLRCDPAPCWNRESNQILVSALADDPDRTRQLFLITLHAE